MINSKNTVVRVGIADLNLVSAPNTIITTGLGSCVGVVIYDRDKKIAGLSHILLPDSDLAKRSKINQYKYADTAIPILLHKLLAKGARKYAMQAKMAGGAQMFKFSSQSTIMRIGSRNIEAAQKQLDEFNIPVVAADVGGNIGRTIEFNPETCKLRIRKINKKEIFI